MAWMDPLTASLLDLLFELHEILSALARLTFEINNLTTV